ncbi:endonuclease/exonuclease/phosphatase family protein [Cesiribacter andamanensis]|uniref:Endonuclease/exonuclease/phosphatase domain-containing protein n=1 Tax=Cesiribacter andamanensis AMV16 TaxID=1279009 RepID=M7NP29_9BACT|nr:endonuclease/exonuclease/phosphatase family protein [Cesiribacter andamanensis]EMR03485.1 hypothetical protein ADICEAN_01334 [Cesiribacter andamanensis AMV16]
MLVINYCLLLLPLLLSTTIVPAAAQSAAEPLRVMSYNLRLDIASDGPDRWPLRRERVAGLIRYHQPQLLGVQEALRHQLQDLQEALPHYKWYGRGRDDGAEGGEFSAILYDTRRFNLLDSGTFWLSPTPNTPGKGWDAAYPRICSWARFRDRQSGRELYHFNTHFDHVGVEAREQSARLLARKISEIAASHPAILSGDFNTTADTKAYANLLAGGLLQEARSLSRTPPYGPEGSFSTFDVANELGKLIDFIFVSNAFSVQQHAILTDAQGGKYPSDHLPVLAVLEWRLP